MTGQSLWLAAGDPGGGGRERPPSTFLAALQGTATAHGLPLPEGNFRDPGREGMFEKGHISGGLQSG